MQTRVIPACAGNGAGRQGRRRGPPGHPRLRGERMAALPSAAPLAGSSPPARGTVPFLVGRVFAHRVIPACAGNGSSPGRPGRVRPGHPRLRGERLAWAVGMGMPHGSSPPARGTAKRERKARNFGRVIPACAGNGSARHEGRPEAAGHPRLRGERKERLTVVPVMVGSSPPARGTARPPRDRGPELPGHPRLRGERIWNSRKGSRSSGSSPPARGTVFSSTYTIQIFM